MSEISTDASAHDSGYVYESPDPHHEHVHVTPFWPMFNVFIALCALTVITVLTAKYVDLPGTGNLILALFLAIFKGTLVAGWFMHLRYDKGMNLVVVFATIFGVVLFLALTMMDIAYRDVVDKNQASEIHPGGNLSLSAAPTLPNDNKGADMSITEWAQQRGREMAAQEGGDAHAGEGGDGSGEQGDGAQPDDASSQQQEGGDGSGH